MIFSYIDIKRLYQQQITQEPFSWGHFTNLIHKDKQSLLHEAYPQQNFNPSCRLYGPKKNYQFNVLKVIQQNQHHDNYTQLPKCWRDFVNEIASKDYLQALLSLFNIYENTYEVDISLFRFEKGDWVEPHVDHQDKLLTQLFYFNQNWDERWGGVITAA